MASIEPSYDELRHRVEELGVALNSLCGRQADTVASQSRIEELLLAENRDASARPDQRLVELREVIEAVPTALAVVGPGGEIRLANRAFLDAARGDSPGKEVQWRLSFRRRGGRSGTVRRWPANRLGIPVENLTYWKRVAVGALVLLVLGIIGYVIEHIWLLGDWK